jgi:hypothetical protein
MEGIIKMNPIEIVRFSGFLRNVFGMGFDEYINSLKNTAKSKEIYPMILKVEIEPNFLLVPVYSYLFFKNQVMEHLGFKTEYKDEINCGNLLQYRIYKLPDNADARIVLRLIPYPKMVQGGMLKQLSVKVNIKAKNRGDIKGMDFKLFISQETLNSVDIHLKVKTLNGLQGKSFEELLRSEPSEIFRTVFYFEEKMFVIINLLYTLYTGEYSVKPGGKDLRGKDKVLIPVIELLRSYGNDFQGVLNSIRMVSAFV